MMMKIGATNEKNDVQSNWAGVLIGPVWESCAWSLMVSSRMAERGARMGGAGRARPSAGQPAIIAKPLLTQTCSWARLIESVAVAAVAQWIEYWPPKPMVTGPACNNSTIGLLTACGCSSVDRVSASEAECRGFDPRQPHQTLHYTQVVAHIVWATSLPTYVNSLSLGTDNDWTKGPVFLRRSVCALGVPSSCHGYGSEVAQLDSSDPWPCAMAGGKLIVQLMVVTEGRAARSSWPSAPAGGFNPRPSSLMGEPWAGLPRPRPCRRFNPRPSSLTGEPQDQRADTRARQVS